MTNEKIRPLIGINMDLTKTPRGQVTHSILQSGYYDCILTAGGIPIAIPPLFREAELSPILDRLDGLVMIGGDDLDPRGQNVAFHQSVNKMAQRREASDRLLCRQACKRRIPTLAIGLGMQEMNVEHGGDLYIHLPEDFPKSMPHYDPHGGVHRHIVLMEPGTLMEEVYGDDEIRVNSQHHQGIRSLATMFRPASHSPDGLIEAFEYHDIDEWWCVGVQWHPENEGHISLDTQLLEAFIEASCRELQKPTLAKVG